MREADAAGLHDEPRAPRGRAGRRERRVEPDRRDRDAEAVGADQAHAVPAAGGEQVSADRRVNGGGEHDEAARPAPSARLGGVDDRRRRDGEHREVRRLRQALDIGEARDAADFDRMRARWQSARLYRARIRPCLPGGHSAPWGHPRPRWPVPPGSIGVNRVELARVTPGLDVVEDRPANRPRAPARPDHRDRAGREQGPEAGHAGGPLAPGDRLQVVLKLAAGVVGRQRDRDGDHAVLALAHDRQARVGEDAEHARVLLQRLGGERLQLPGAGERDEVLEQQRGDAPVVHGVRDRERDLRRPAPVGGNLVAGEPDNLAVGQREQGGVVGPRLPGDPPRLLLGREPAEAEEAQVGVAWCHRLVHVLHRGVVRGCGRPDLDGPPVGQQGVHDCTIRRGSAGAPFLSRRGCRRLPRGSP